MTEVLSSFLSGIDKSFEKYADILINNGLSSVDELQHCGEEDFKFLKIPIFHWRRILNAVKLEKPQEALEALDATWPGKAQEFNRATQCEAVAKSVSSLDNKVKQRVMEFYALYNPDLVNDEESINQLLKKYAGNTSQLFHDLEQKYVLGKDEDTQSGGGVKKTKAKTVTEGLSNLYMTNIRELEKVFEFPKFHTSLLSPVDFETKPMVLLIGQYSVGKTSFIKYLIKRDFPGIRIGPEPTTDCFQAVMHGNQERLVLGNAACMDNTKPFKTLASFGMGFMNRFNVSEIPAPILESITFVDTPGILSGAKQRMGRNYDFSKIVEWFAYKADRILLLFDAHKLDISDELKVTLDCLRGHDNKVKVVLNKADQISNQQLLRVYGALMWSLGKVFKTPEVLRVYVGSFWDQGYKNDHNSELFDAESADLLSDLRGLPRHSATRKINKFVKRTRRLKVHLLIIQYLREKVGWFGKKKQAKVIGSLGQIFREIAEKHNMNLSDFPPPSKFRQQIENIAVHNLPKIKKRDIAVLTEILEHAIPRLMEDLPSNSVAQEPECGAFNNPFAGLGEENDAAVNAAQAWIVDSTMKATYDVKFHALSLTAGKVSGAQVMNVMLQSGLQRATLEAIWNLSDIDRDGKMDNEEFALCMYLIDHVKKGLKLPPTLPMRMVPPGKRKLLDF